MWAVFNYAVLALHDRKLARGSCVVNGVPGTGKSFVIVPIFNEALLFAMLSNMGFKVGIITYTNLNSSTLVEFLKSF